MGFKEIQTLHRDIHRFSEKSLNHRKSYIILYIWGHVYIYICIYIYILEWGDFHMLFFILYYTNHLRLEINNWNMGL
jgi:hypothetical protein